MRMHYSDTFIDSLILEDCPYGALTTASLGIGARKGRMRFYPRAEKCTVSGTEPAARILSRCGLTVESRMEDGLAAEGKPCLLSCTGRADDLHRAWKIAQNVLEYMCGIATRAQDMVSAARRGRPDIAVAATRKNFPGAKLLSLAAATDGGCIVHRAGLSESLLFFDRHIAFLGGEDRLETFARLLPSIRRAAPEKRVICEADSVETALRFARAGADGVQLDKFSPADLARAVSALRAVSPRLLVLAAGGINAGNAEDMAAAGPDVLVTSWIYSGRPQDIRVTMETL